MLRTFVATVVTSLLLGSIALAQPAPPALSQKLTLQALGGVTFDVPAWSTVKRDDGSAVLEQTPDAASRRPFRVLLLAIEPAPSKDIDWDRVKANIEQAASDEGRTLTLDESEAFAGPVGFEGRLMTGSYQSGEQKVGFELISFFRSGRLLTVSLVSARPDESSRALLQQVARTVVIDAR